MKKTFLRHSLWEYSFFAVILFILFYKLFDLGLEYDELLSANAALGCPHPTMFLHYFKFRLGVCIPLMLMDYIGAPIALIPKISSMLFGTSVYSFRGFNMALIFITIVGLYSFAKRHLGKTFAFLTTFFLVFDSQFIFTQWLDRPTVFPFIARCILLMLLFANKFPYQYFWVGLVAGISIYAKFDNFYIVGSILSARVLFELLEKKGWVFNTKSLKRYLVIFGQFIFPFTLSMFPVIKYMQYYWKSFLAVVDSYKVYRVGYDFAFQTKVFLSQLTNSELYSYVFRIPLNISPFFTSISKLLVLGWLLASLGVIFYRNFKYRWLGAASLLFFFCYLKFPAMSGPHHRLLIYPLPQMALAAIMGALIKMKKFGKKIVLAYMFLYLSVFVVSYLKMQTAISQTCGVMSFNCGIYPLASSLAGEEKDVVVADWGVATQLLYLSGGHLKVQEVVFDGLFKKIDAYGEVVVPFLDNCSPVVLRYPGLAKYPGPDAMTRQMLDRYSKYHVETIYDRLGKPQFQIFTCGEI